MREIKFRGKRLDNGEWILGYYIKNPDIEETVISDGYECYPVDPATVGQYTGLNDENGRKIYEGDIISDGRRFHVVWDTRDACWTGEMHNDPQQRLDVGFLITHKLTCIIGNIHDNPELLKKH